jgi:hypothetical protein
MLDRGLNWFDRINIHPTNHELLSLNIHTHYVTAQCFDFHLESLGFWSISGQRLASALDPALLQTTRSMGAFVERGE